MLTILKFPFKLLAGFLKLSGVRGGVLLAVGVVLGLLFAPERGAVLRARLKARVAEARRGAVPEDLDPVV
ncbi:MAG: YtxH domain-containing protein [Acidimicrobiales bacterium]|nr:YtxH domain-containing protein [Acidimicrobiales bacterium]